MDTPRDRLIGSQESDWHSGGCRHNVYRIVACRNRIEVDSRKAAELAQRTTAMAPLAMRVMDGSATVAEIMGLCPAFGCRQCEAAAAS